MAFVGTPPELAIAVCQAGGIRSVDELSLPAGEAVGFVHNVRPSRETVVELVSEARAFLNELPTTDENH